MGTKTTLLLLAAALFATRECSCRDLRRELRGMSSRELRAEPSLTYALAEYAHEPILLAEFRTISRIEAVDSKVPKTSAGTTLAAQRPRA